MRAKTAVVFFLIILVAIVTMSTGLAKEPSLSTPVEKTFDIKTEAEVEMIITAMAPGTDWEKKDTESAVLTVSVDGKYNQDIVLFMGKTPFDYRVLLGHLKPGTHKVLFSVEKWKSPPKAGQVNIQNVTYINHDLQDENYLIYKFAPILYGREVNNHSDVPLYEWHELVKDDTGKTSIQYSITWTNEDSRYDSLGLATLMCDWGRATDIEWVYKVTLGLDGNIVEEKYQAPGHEHNIFTGDKVDFHPILKVGTLNNNISQSGNSQFRFFMSPTWTLPGSNLATPAESQPRELLMDSNGWTFQMMAKELSREGKLEKKANPDSNDVSDFRNYIYLGYLTKCPQDQLVYGSGYNSHKYIVHHVAVQLRNNEKWYSNDHNQQLPGKGKDGWARTTIELPPGTNPKDITKLQFYLRPKTNDLKSYELTLQEITPLFMLDRNYNPMPSLFKWSGAVKLDQDNPSIVFDLEKDNIK